MGAASFGDIASLRFADATTRRSARSSRKARTSWISRPSGRAPPYPAAVLWIGRDDGLARRLRLSLASGKPAKEVRFTNYDEKGRVGTMEIRDLLAAKGKNVTTLTF